MDEKIGKKIIEIVLLPCAVAPLQKVVAQEQKLSSNDVQPPAPEFLS